jgi:hypothetical protein
MKKSEMRKIIESYKPTKGFFNLSRKPENLNGEEYAKILKTQMFLVEQNEHREYLRTHNPTQWDKLKELSAELQCIIFEHWGDSVFV